MSVESTIIDVGRRGLPKGGLEPPCPFEHNALNVACLPISPLRQVMWFVHFRSDWVDMHYITVFVATCQGDL